MNSKVHLADLSYVEQMVERWANDRKVVVFSIDRKKGETRMWRSSTETLERPQAQNREAPINIWAFTSTLHYAAFHLTAAGGLPFGLSRVPS